MGGREAVREKWREEICRQRNKSLFEYIKEKKKEPKALKSFEVGTPLRASKASEIQKPNPAEERGSDKNMKTLVQSFRHENPQLTSTCAKNSRPYWGLPYIILFLSCWASLCSG